MILSEAEAKRITEKALSLSKADSCTVSLSGRERGHIRFALNSVTTSGRSDQVTLSVESNFGTRSGTVSVNELDDASLVQAVHQSEEMARLAPEDPEFMPPVGPQRYLTSRVYFRRTAGAGPDQLARLCLSVLDTARARGVTAAGFLDAGTGFSCIATSAGLFVYEKGTRGGFTASARATDGSGAGWAGQSFHDIGRVDPGRLAKIMVDKTLSSREPIALAPGKYTVILEPSAVCDLVGLMINQFDARRADEGRSFLARKGGGNRLGEKVFGDQVTIHSDPHDPVAPGSVYSSDGLPARRRVWVERGVVKELISSRFWSHKAEREPVPYPTNLVMAGGDVSIEQMIRETKRGVLVTRLWYIRPVDPRTLLYTGLTRDGTFLIEEGKLRRPVKNFRFNESPVAMLNNVIALGPTERAIGSEIEDQSVSVPPLLVKEFNFASLSDAV